VGIEALFLPLSSLSVILSKATSAIGWHLDSGQTSGTRAAQKLGIESARLIRGHCIKAFPVSANEMQAVAKALGGRISAL
jgi:hypothetical protein